MKTVRRSIDRALGWILVAFMAAAVLNVLWQVFTRWALQDPSSYTEELARYLLVWIGLLGAAYGVGQKLHLAIDLVPEILSEAHRRILAIVIQFTVFGFAISVMTIGGLRLVWLSFRFGQVSAALGIPLGYVYLVLPIGGILIVYYSICVIQETLSADDGADEPDRSGTVGRDM